MWAKALCLSGTDAVGVGAFLDAGPEIDIPVADGYAAPGLAGDSVCFGRGRKCVGPSVFPDDGALWPCRCLLISVRREKPTPPLGEGGAADGR